MEPRDPLLRTAIHSPAAIPRVFRGPGQPGPRHAPSGFGRPALELGRSLRRMQSRASLQAGGRVEQASARVPERVLVALVVLRHLRARKREGGPKRLSKSA